jgi:hypothetical protein
MFVSHAHKLLFFEVPRTGSRSITRALTTMDPRSPTAVVRMVKRNLYHYHVYDQRLVDRHPEYTLIAVHRNPFDRIRSHYKYRKQFGNPDELKRFSFEDYIRWVCLAELLIDIAPAMIDRPITELLPYSKVNYWLSFDNLVGDWQRMATNLKLDLPILPHINHSNSKLDSEAIYTAPLAKLMQNRFIKDFEQFGYELGSW